MPYLVCLALPGTARSLPLPYPRSFRTELQLVQQPNGPRITREREGWRGVCRERSEPPCRRRDTQARRVHTLVSRRLTRSGCA